MSNGCQDWMAMTSIGCPLGIILHTEMTSTGHLLKVHRMSTGCLELDVHWMSTGCSSDVHWTSKIGHPLDIHWMYTGHLLIVQQVHRPKYVQKTSNGCPLDVYHGHSADVHWISVKGLWDVQWMSVLNVQWMSNGHQPKVHGMSCGCSL